MKTYLAFFQFWRELLVGFNFSAVDVTIAGAATEIPASLLSAERVVGVELSTASLKGP